MKAAKTSVIDAFIAELACTYDTECRVCAMFSNLVANIRSKSLKAKLLRYVDGSALTQAKLEMLFHMVGYKICSKASDPVAHIIEECMQPALHGDDDDLTTTHHIDDIVNFKVSHYQTLIELSKLLPHQGATAVLRELHSYEVKIL